MLKKIIFLSLVPLTLTTINSCATKNTNAANEKSSSSRKYNQVNSETPSLDEAMNLWENHGHHDKPNLVTPKGENQQNSKTLLISYENIDNRIAQWIADLKSENPNKVKIATESFKNYLSQITTYFEVVASMVHDFDKKVENRAKNTSAGEDGIDLSQDEDYQLLLLSRELHEQYENDLKVIYSTGLKSIYNNFSESNKEFKSLLSTMAEFITSPQELQKKHGLFNFAKSLEEVNNILINEDKVNLNKLNDSLISVENLIKSLNNFLSKSKETFKSEMKELDKLKGQFKNDLKEFRKTRLKYLEKAFRELFKGKDNSIREPNSTASVYPFKPSPDEYGTVSGRTFPNGQWAITLDDGPSKYTQEFLNHLDIEKGERYTFFWLSKLITNEKYSEVVKKAHDIYHCERASHSMTHANLSKLNETGLDYEVNNAINDFKEAVGEETTMFRCPYGACGKLGRERIASLGLIHTFWNVDSLDWQDKDPENIVQRVKNQMTANKKGIILFHDIHPQSVVASKIILEYIRNNDTLKLVTVGDKLKENYSQQKPSKVFDTP
jgi:peptidoglycan/xylan/chitin deacetylase (PgdA/CDA1 family)